MGATPHSGHRNSGIIDRWGSALLTRHCVFVPIFYFALFTLFFSPVILAGKFLAVGPDGLYNFLPNFYSKKVLWDSMVFGGFPMMADPEAMAWYPPAFLMSRLPGGWNLFVIAAYVAGSSFTYGYLYSLTKSWLAALISGLVFGLSGFMMAHLVHAHVIHSAAWVPLMIWSLGALRQRLSAPWLIVGSMAGAFMFLGGQPQIFVYGMLLGTCYAIALGWNAPTGRWRYYLVVMLMLAVGIGLAAVQIIPTAELAAQGSRVGYSFRDYVSHSLPPRQTLTMVFPFVFGGVPGSGMMNYFGGVNQTELTGYVGLLPVLFAVVAVIASGKKSVTLFWACVAAFAIVLVLGDATPVARLIYHVPVFNNFRAPARHLLEFTIAMSVLSGIGVAAILKQKISSAFALRVIVLAGLAMLVCGGLLFLNSSSMAGLAPARSAAQLRLAPWSNRAVGVPIAVFAIAVTTFVYWGLKPTSRLRSALLLSVLVIDLGSFGWFYEWRYAALDQNDLKASALDVRYRDLLNDSGQRLIPFRSAFGSVSVAPPTLSRLWSIPSASGYNALILSRTSHMLSINELGELAGPPGRVPSDSSFNVMAIRYIFLPPRELNTDEAGVSWLKDDMQQSFGSGCDHATPNSTTWTLPAPFESSSIAMVSRLACSAQIPDGAEVARIRLMDVDDSAQTLSLIAGRDSSEWAFDCRGVNSAVRHSRANIFRNYPGKLYDEPCEGHSYVTRVPLTNGARIKSVQLQWVGPAPGMIIIDKISLIDDARKNSFPIDPALTAGNGWQLIGDTATARVYENTRAMPRAWLVPSVKQVSAEAALNAVRTQSLPDGTKFDPQNTALVEVPAALIEQGDAGAASAKLTTLSDTRLDVHTSSTTPGFLLTSDTYYPGWRASIDGRETEIYRADYAIRGVIVPAGEHTVRFDYRPRSFYLGAGISLISMLLLGAIAVGARSFGLGAGRKTEPGETQ